MHGMLLLVFSFGTSLLVFMCRFSSFFIFVLFVYLSICFSVYMSALFFSVYLFVLLTFCLSVCYTVCLSICLLFVSHFFPFFFVSQPVFFIPWLFSSACLWACLYFCLFLCLSVHLSVCLPICLSICLSGCSSAGASMLVAVSLLRVDASHPVVSSVALCVQRQRRFGGVASSLRCRRQHFFFCG